jgi:hypothetical protein
VDYKSIVNKLENQFNGFDSLLFQLNWIIEILVEVYFLIKDQEHIDRVDGVAIVYRVEEKLIREIGIEWFLYRWEYQS